MKYTDINKEFDSIVKSFMSRPEMTIHTPSMSGTEGEYAKIDFTDGTNIYRVVMMHFDEEPCYEGITIVVGRAEGEKPYTDNWTYNIWNNNLVDTTVYKYYKVSHFSDYYVTKEEMIEINKKRTARALNKFVSEHEAIEDPKALALIGKAVARRLGQKRVRKDSLTRATKYTAPDRIWRYTVEYKGKCFVLH